jgi:tetratricopeptide (TPR) repeat protein
MSKLFLYFLGSCAIFSLVVSTPSWAQKDSGDDYKFYKKYGHHHKSWDEAVRKGFKAYDAQDCNQAMTYLKEAISHQSKNGIVFFKLAACSELLDSPYTAMQYYQLAEEKFQTMKGAHRYQKEIYENYGRALFKAKRYKEALPYLTRAAAVGTPSFALYYMVGSLYAKNNDWNAAIDYFRRALTQDTSGIDPKLLSQVYYEVAKTYYQAKDYQQAKDLLEKAVKLDPSNQKAIQLRNQVGTGLQQQSIVDMLKQLSPGQDKPKESPKSAPPPPAASQLPPLNGGNTDPTPPLGEVKN